jgi:hypothetical protein
MKLKLPVVRMRRVAGHERGHLPAQHLAGLLAPGIGFILDVARQGQPVGLLDGGQPGKQRCLFQRFSSMAAFSC